MGVDTPQAVAPIDTTFTHAKREKRTTGIQNSEIGGSWTDHFPTDSAGGHCKAYAADWIGRFRIHRKGPNARYGRERALYTLLSRTVLSLSTARSLVE